MRATVCACCVRLCRKNGAAEDSFGVEEVLPELEKIRALWQVEVWQRFCSQMHFSCGEEDGGKEVRRRSKTEKMQPKVSEEGLVTFDQVMAVKLDGPYCGSQED